MQYIKALVLASTEAFNRDTSLQSAEHAPTVFYSCKDFAGTVGRREWGGNVFPLGAFALNCSLEPRSCKSRQGAAQTLLSLLDTVLPHWVWPRSSLIGLAYASNYLY